MDGVVYLFELANLLAGRLVDLEDAESAAQLQLLLLERIELSADAGHTSQRLGRGDVGCERTLGLELLHQRTNLLLELL